MISCSYFNKVKDLWVYDDSLRYIDRLFFDFDYHDETSDEIGNQRKECLENKDYKGFKKTQKLLSNHVLHSDLLEKPLSEALKVVDYWKSKGINSLLFFSGSSGFHLNILFEGANLPYANEIAKSYFTSLNKKFCLETSDEKVTDLLKRKQRVPYSTNFKSGLKHCLVEGRDLDSILKEIKNPKIVDISDFDIAPSGFTKHLMNMNEKKKQIHELHLQKIEKQKENMKIRNPNSFNKNSISSKDSLFDDMRVLLKFIASDYLVKENPEKKYDIYRCMFHEDKKPSSRCYKKNFLCTSSNCDCGSVNYFEFLRKFYNLNSDDEVKKKMSEINLKFHE